MLKLNFLFVCLFVPFFGYSFICLFIFGKKKASYILAGYPVVGLPMMLLAKVVLIRLPRCSSKSVCYHASVVCSILFINIIISALLNTNIRLLSNS